MEARTLPSRIPLWEGKCHVPVDEAVVVGVIGGASVIGGGVIGGVGVVVGVGIVVGIGIVVVGGVDVVMLWLLSRMLLLLLLLLFSMTMMNLLYISGLRGCKS